MYTHANRVWPWCLGDNKDTLSLSSPPHSNSKYSTKSFCQVEPTWLPLWTVQSRHRSWDSKPLSLLTATPLSHSLPNDASLSQLTALLPLSQHFPCFTCHYPLRIPPIPGNCQMRIWLVWQQCSAGLQSEQCWLTSAFAELHSPAAAAAPSKAPTCAHCAPLTTNIQHSKPRERLHLAGQASTTLA